MVITIFKVVFLKNCEKPLMDFGKKSQQTCFESVRIKRILGRVACFHISVLRPALCQPLAHCQFADRGLLPKKPCQILHLLFATILSKGTELN